MKKRLLAIAMTLAMTLSLLPVTALASEGENTPSAEATRVTQDRASDSELSGSCGNGLTWQINEDNVLTVSGDGSMQDYDPYSAGILQGYGRNVSKVVVEEGVTHIGANAFNSLMGTGESNKIE